MSVSIPTPIDNPISEIRLRDIPANAKKANVNIIATGRAAETKNVALIFFKNTSNTIVANTSPCTALLETLEIDCSISSDVSSSVLYSVPGGITDFKLSRAFIAALFNSIVLPSADFSTATTIDSFPDKNPLSVKSSVVKTISATSFNFNVLPLL